MKSFNFRVGGGRTLLVLTLAFMLTHSGFSHSGFFLETNNEKSEYDKATICKGRRFFVSLLCLQKTRAGAVPAADNPHSICPPGEAEIFGQDL